MNGVSHQERQLQTARPARAWSRGRRLMVSLPIFIILLGVLVSISNLTATTWNYEPTGQTIETLASDTAITFDDTTGKAVAKQGDYEVSQRYITIDAKQPSTGEIQKIKVLIREPKGAGGNRPGVVFMHGAGYGTCDNSFGDIAYDLSSAGFVTAVLDKPVWSTNDATRDYPGSAAIYDQVITYLRSLDNVSETGAAPAMETVDLLDVARECVERQKVNARHSYISLTYLGESAPVAGSRSLLDELCQNLCDNAIRYNRPGGKVQIITACTRDGHCTLTVKDNGIGIPKEAQTSVFERFYRVDKSRSKATGGTGLGLAIVKHIARIHNARIKLDSVVDEGTTITVIFETAS